MEPEYTQTVHICIRPQQPEEGEAAHIFREEPEWEEEEEMR